MEYSEIIDEIKSQLTGNDEEDRKYLQEQMEKYKEHKLAKEIIKECARMLFDLLPINTQTRLSDAIEDEKEKTAEKIKKIRKCVAERKLDDAMEQCINLIDEVESTHFFNEDEVSEYYSFDNLFKRILFEHYHKTQKEIRESGIPYDEIYYIYGNILFELKRYDEAKVYLEKALKWNPTSSVIAFEYIELFKVKKDYETFFKLTKDHFKYAFQRKDLARCFRNYGYYFIEKQDYIPAITCYLFSELYDQNDIAENQIKYIKSKDETADVDVELIEKYAEKYGFETRASKETIYMAYAWAKKAIEEERKDFAIYFLSIVDDLIDDEEVKETLKKLKEDSANERKQPSHLSDVGIVVNEENFYDVITDIFSSYLEYADEFPFEEKSYVLVKLDDIEFWLTCEGEEDIDPYNFGLFYDTNHNVKVCEPTVVSVNDDTSAIVRVWSEDGEIPFNIEIPNPLFLKENPLDENKTYKCRVACFAGRMEAYKDEEEFHKENENVDVRYFIPIGQFEEEETADASFAGIVKSIELKTNSHTGLSFYHLIVENAAMEFDVIMEEKFTPKIELGDIVSVVGWLSGKIYL